MRSRQHLGKNRRAAVLTVPAQQRQGWPLCLQQALRTTCRFARRTSTPPQNVRVVRVSSKTRPSTVAAETVRIESPPILTIGGLQPALYRHGARLRRGKANRLPAPSCIRSALGADRRSISHVMTLPPKPSHRPHSRSYTAGNGSRSKSSNSTFHNAGPRTESGGTPLWTSSTRLRRQGNPTPVRKRSVRV
ncbi:hypothetical protein EVAR_89953_1 [Eumeta japonica]|uniref:Uncharacterized protein n=1 Tax=Eumeta variegata TaxID=151549 RepID=A0A4C2A8H0_EUMVA|nr:hypothetical protein EVAR_89953_1 [Eumeta japonica]